MHLNIFSNVTHQIKEHKTIKTTLNSFIKTFGKPSSVSVYLHCEPNKNDADWYIEYLKKRITNDIILTDGLTDGFIKSIENAKHDVIFNMEHDWIFVKENIHNTLDEYTKLVLDHSITALRFNTINNSAYRPDYGMSPVDEHLLNGIKVMSTMGIDNAVNIINVQNYKDKALKYIKNFDRSFYDDGCGGLEENMKNRPKAGGFCLGHKTSDPTVKHIDGRLGTAKKYYNMDEVNKRRVSDE